LSTRQHFIFRETPKTTFFTQKEAELSDLAKKAYELFKKPDAPSWEELERRKGEKSTRAENRDAAPTCPTCGGGIEIEAREPSLDGKRVIAWWRCPSCATWGATPEGWGYPLAWVSKEVQ
jgi:hypothetical protein